MKTLQQELIDKKLSDASIQEKQVERVKVNKSSRSQLSAWELAELMGTNRDTYKRVRGGAIRRR